MRVTTFNFGKEQLKYCYVTSPSEATLVLSNHVAKAKVYGLDTETMPLPEYKDHPKGGLDPHLTRIRLVQIFDGKAVWIFDFLEQPNLMAHSLFSFLLLNKFLAHNAVFELKHLREMYGYREFDIGCSMIMGMLVDRAEHSPFEPDEEEDESETDEKVGAGLGHYKKRGGYGLDNLTALHLGIRVDKTHQKSNWSKPKLSPEQLCYAALDAVLTVKLAKHLSKKIKQYKMQRVYALLKRMQYVIAEMELKGFGINTKEHKALVKSWKQEEKEAIGACVPHFGDVNIRSSKQLNAWAKKTYPRKTLSRWPTTKKGALSFNRGQLYMLNQLPAIAALLRYKKVFKLISGYGETLEEKINPATNRIHCSFFLGETRTGRLSCRDPNLQNMPRDGNMRHIFCARENNILVSADFSQIEMRVAGEISKDPVIRKCYEDGVDLHKAIVASLTGKKIKDITKEERQLGKAINFGLLFGMGPNKLTTYAKMSYGVTMSDAEAEKAWNVFHKTYRHYSAWCNVRRQQCEKIGYVRTPMGKMRKLLHDEVYTKAINTPVQGGAAEVAFCSLVRCLKAVHSTGISIVNTVHDEIILECDPSQQDMAKGILQECMEQGMLDVFPDATTNGLVEVKVGKNWQETKQ